jgi:hypothetical protein
MNPEEYQIRLHRAKKEVKKVVAKRNLQDELEKVES